MENQHEIITDNKKFPCKNCGAFLVFEPGADSLKCQYCGELNEIEKEKEIDIIEEDFEKILIDLSNNTENCMTVHQIKCDACGAVSTMPENVTSANCPFCGSSVVLSNEAVGNIIKPKYLIPFKINKNGSQESFRNWTKKLFFAPNKLKKMATIDSINGVYIPCWTYDAQTETDYTGERGDRYTETVIRNGKPQTVTRIRWSYRAGHISHFFNDILVTASQSLPNDLAKKMTNWNYTELVQFKEEFLSGFRTEIYQLDVKAGFDTAKNMMYQQIQTLIRRDIGGNEQRIHSQNTSYSNITFKHLLLPIWISSYMFKNKRYHFLVNGQNGTVVGSYPKSFWKIAGVILLSAIIIAALYWFTGGFN